METFFMNTKNSKTNEPHLFKYNLIDKLDLKNPNKNMALANLSIYYTWKNVKSIYKNNKFKISAPTWNETFDLSDGSYNIPAIQNYFEYVKKKYETIADTAPILIYANNVINRIVFQIKTGYKLEPTWNETFDLPDGSYNISEIQDYIEYIIKKHETIGKNAPILIYANTINNRIVFKIKSGYKLELLSKETMKLLGSTSSIIDKDKIVILYQN